MNRSRAERLLSILAEQQDELTAMMSDYVRRGIPLPDDYAKRVADNRDEAERVRALSGVHWEL